MLIALHRRGPILYHWRHYRSRCLARRTWAKWCRAFSFKGTSLAGFIYLDETGDTGFKFERGSSHYYVVTLMIVADQIPMRNAVDDLRTELRFTDGIEFKFSRSSNAIRQRFFSAIRRLDISAVSIAADKHDFMEYRALGHAALHSEIIKTLLLDCHELFENATLIIDESTKGRRHQRNLTTSLRTALNAQNAAPKLARIIYHQSHRDNLLQAVDMISGAVNAEAEINSDY
jgi:hypothetical protein